VKHSYLLPRLIHPKQLSPKSLEQLQHIYGKMNSLSEIFRANRADLHNLERQRLNGNCGLAFANLTAHFESTEHSVEFLQQFGSFLQEKTRSQRSQPFILKTESGKYLREVSPDDRGFRNLDRCRKKSSISSRLFSRTTFKNVI
jgi:hypothetical protein